jgi:hypothetical protein
MDGAVVAGEASVVGCFRGKCAGVLYVTNGAFFFENGMRFGQAAAAEDAGVFEDRSFRDPKKREQRQ